MAGMNLRRVARDLGIVALVFGVGYVLVALWIAPSLVLRGDRHAVPHLLGLPDREARAQLTALGFRPRGTGAQAHPSVARGAVIWQDPPPGVVLAPNGVVTLAVSAGAAPVPVPDVAGLDTASARHILRAAGLRAGDMVTMTGGQEGEIVIVTRPGIGTLRPRGSAVDLIVGQGTESAP